MQNYRNLSKLSLKYYNTLCKAYFLKHIKLLLYLYMIFSSLTIVLQRCNIGCLTLVYILLLNYVLQTQNYWLERNVRGTFAGYCRFRLWFWSYDSQAWLTKWSSNLTVMQQMEVYAITHTIKLFAILSSWIQQHLK